MYNIALKGYLVIKWDIDVICFPQAIMMGQTGPIYFQDTYFPSDSGKKESVILPLLTASAVPPFKKCISTILEISFNA